MDQWENKGGKKKKKRKRVSVWRKVELPDKSCSGIMIAGGDIACAIIIII